MADQIPLARPNLGISEVEAVADVLRSGWITQGPKVRDFESGFAQFTGARQACAVSNCTAGLHLALLAVGVRPGDVVVTVSHSFIATANAVRHCQAEAVFVDIDADTFNMSPDALERCLGQDFKESGGALWYRHVERVAQGESPLVGRSRPIGRLAAVLVVHQVGMPADLSRIRPLAEHYSLPLVEDAACASGSEVTLDEGQTWDKIGLPHGAAACFSFHPRKVITTGDGGMLTTNDISLAERVRLLRHQGMNVSDLARHESTMAIIEEYPVTGFNYRLTDLQAAIGVSQLERLTALVAERRALANTYTAQLEEIPQVAAPREPDYAKSNWQSYIVRLQTPLVQLDLMNFLLRHGIQSRRGVMCTHLETPYAQAWASYSLPESERASNSTIALPFYCGIRPEDVTRVVHTIAEYFGT